MTDTEQSVNAQWRAMDGVGVVRVTAGGGGSDLTIAQAVAFRDRLDEAIAAARLITGMGGARS